MVTTLFHFHIVQPGCLLGLQSAFGPKPPVPSQGLHVGQPLELPHWAGAFLEDTDPPGSQEPASRLRQLPQLLRPLDVTPPAWPASLCSTLGPILSAGCPGCAPCTDSPVPCLLRTAQLYVGQPCPCLEPFPHEP